MEATKSAAPSSFLGFFTSANPTTLFQRFTPAIGISPAPTRPTSAANSRRPSQQRLLRSSKAGGQAQAHTWERRLQERSYSLKFVLIAAIISFLLGSLIRSLLSPADFMYFPARGTDAGEDASGWREVRRLVEVKWVLWGWDAVIFAVVRR